MKGKKIKLTLQQKIQLIKLFENIKPLVESGLSFDFIGKLISAQSVNYSKFGFSFDEILEEFKLWLLKQ